MQPSPKFLAKAPDLLRSIAGYCGPDAPAPQNLLYKIYFSIFNLDELHSIRDLRSSVWNTATALCAASLPPKPEDYEILLSTYLLVLCEVCNIDIETILGDSENEQDREKSPV